MNSSISPIRLERSQHKSPPRMNTRKSRKDRLNSTPSAARRLFETSSPNQSEIRKSRRKVPMHTLKKKLSSMTPLDVENLPADLTEDDFSPRDITKEDIENMIDPITLSIFSNPVMINNDDRHTFELDVITKWVKKKGTNPRNRDPITIKDITPNIARRRLIERAIRQYIRRGGKYKRRTNKRRTDNRRIDKRRTDKRKKKKKKRNTKKYK